GSCRTICCLVIFETHSKAAIFRSGSTESSRPTMAASVSGKRRYRCTHRNAMPEHQSRSEPSSAGTSRVRTLIAHVFTWIEDIVYIGLGALLAASALALLVHTAASFSHDLVTGSVPTGIVGILDRLLLVLMIVELLYTVQVSFREHALVPEPFL